MRGLPPLFTIPVTELVLAYSEGRFPMCHDNGELYWHDPDTRAIFPLEGIKPNARAQRAFRRAGFSFTHDQAFEQVIRACADRKESWIDERIIASFLALHRAGYAHSVETWDEGKVIGGIYGISLERAFFGESMFSRKPNAGKAAFYHLADHLRLNGFTLFDTQYINAHTRSLGAVEVAREEFRRMLVNALK
ncbi:MAG: leucyl/phenylalanyl-tRNA--protein transferase [Flavobacteriales bacterium]|nr:leucyl/phenylalanyl-tRNA--protein transferase [Flavobacteriales bacterium]